MTTEEIKQGNELIAKFMGWEYEIHSHTYRLGDSIRLNINFNSNWELIMPVVEKIQSISTESIRSVDFSLDAEGWIIWMKDRTGDQNMPQWYCEEEHIPKKEGIWKACVEFIKWYNESR